MSTLLSSFALTILLILILKVVFRRMGWLDKPHLFGYQRSPVPYGLGIVFFLSFALIGPAFIDVSAKMLVVFIAAAILTITSFVDDRMKLPPIPRLLIQTVCAAAVVLAGVNVPALTNPFGAPIILDAIRWSFSVGSATITITPIADALAVVWIVFVMNALNWLDGAPGIVSGISTIACAVIYLLATEANLHVIDQSTLATMALIIGASTFAFLFFDFPKPKVLMGDSGTMFLGLMIAVMAIFSGGKLATAFIVLAFPILDAIWTIVRRLINKQSPFKGDFQHFHHELLQAGLSERQVNLFYYVFSLGFGLLTLTLNSLGKAVAIVILFAVMTTLRVLILRRRFR